MRRNKKIKWIILGICAAALVAWGVLMVTIFGGDSEKPGKETPTPTAGASSKKGNTVVVWRLKEIYECDGEGGRSRQASYEYDEQGRCVKEIRYQGNYDEPEVIRTERTYSYDEETHFSTWRIPKLYVNEKEEFYEEVNETSYDSAGTRRAVTSYQQGTDGTLVKSKEEVFDEHGKDLAARYYELGTGKLTYANEFTRDALGNVITEKEYSVETGAWNTIFSSDCDEQGRVTSTYKIQNGQSRLYTEIIYHEDGSRRVQIYSVDEEELYVGQIYVYDSQGRQCEYCGLSLEGEEEKKETREYLESPEGTIEKRTLYYNGQLDATVEIRRDLNGRVMYLEMHEYSEYGDWDVLYQQFCDEEGRVMRSVYEDVYEIVYTYDEHGNRITSTMDQCSYEYEYIPIEISEEQAKENELFYQPEPIPDDGESVWSSLETRRW